jgi:hypothetical protein
MMRTKLHLTDEEIMNKSWIALSLEMADFPYYDYKAKKIIKDKSEADKIFAKYMNK